jgi:molybdopterin-containing oxidoreductase family molybdopterin binding subunit
MAAAAGAAALAGSFAGCAPKPEDGGTAGLPPEPAAPPEEQVYQGVCRANCSGGCRMNVHVREGKVVKTSAIHNEDPREDRICQRGLTHAQRVYAPERIQYPMRRKEGTARGAGEWERITWDEAVTYITDKWKGYIEESGPSSVAYTFGAGTYAANQYVYMRLFNMIGGTQFEQMYDMAGLNICRDITGRGLYLHGNDFNDIVNCKYFFNWGCNNTISGLPGWAFIDDAVRNHGMQVITIDPNYTDTAARSAQWVPLKAGTDTPLAYAMMNLVIEEGKADVDYLVKNTPSAFLVRDDNGMFLRMSDLGVEPTEGPPDRTGKPTVIDPRVFATAEGEFRPEGDDATPTIEGAFDAQGVACRTVFELLAERAAEWPVERASEVCDIPADVITDLAHKYAEGPSIYAAGFGIDHWGDSASYHAAICLAAVAGQIGKKGTGIHSRLQGAMGSNMNIGGAVFPQGATGGLMSALLYLPKIMETGTYGENPLVIKSLFNYCGNPLASHVDRNALIAAFDKIDLIVDVEIVMNDTARYSDIVLPHPHWFEFNTVNTTPTAYADLSERCVEPQFESKVDTEISRLLGNAMGFDNMDLGEDDYYNLLFDNDNCREYGLNWADLKEKKHILFAQLDYLFGNKDLGSPFATASGLAEFYFEDRQPIFPHGQGGYDKREVALPYWSRALEAYDENPLKETYPLNIVTYRDRFKTHTAYALCPWLLEIAPEPTLQVSPVDAEPRGIADGDYVKVYNDRGSVVLKAWLDASMRPGMVRTEHTWLQEQYKEGHYDSLTSVAVREPFPSTSPNDCLVQVEKN